MTETTNESTLKVVKDDEETQETTEQAKPKTNRELAVQGIEEICAKYNLKPFHLAEAMSNKVKESTDLLKNEAAMYENNIKAMNNKVLYKELIAREIKANKDIDNHAQEMQQYENNVIEALLGWIKANSNPTIDNMMSIMEQELRLPYDKISRMYQGKINEQVDKMRKSLEESYIKDCTDYAKKFCNEFANASRKERKVIIAKYSA